MTTYQKKIRVIAEFLVVAICTLAFALTSVGIIGSLMGHNAAGTRDFVEYWAAGHQLVHHANPYDGEALLRLERSVGFPADLPAQIMANPPWALTLVLPLGFLSPMAAELLWLLLLLASLMASVRMVWIMHDRPKTQVNFLGYTFGPALFCLLLGQVSIFLLLGVVLFLRLHRSRPFLAGISLWLCMLKPHLFLPFGTVLLLWVITTGAYRVLAGTTVALAVNTAVAFIMDPHVWAHYRQMMVSVRIDRVPIPCFSILLRQHIWPHTLWLQCLPAVLGCAWSLFYYRRHRDNWDWLAHGSPLVLLSVLVAPYTWFIDQAVVIPALLHGAYITRSRSLVALLALASAVIEIQGLLGASALHSVLFLWTTPAWILWCLCACKSASESPDQLSEQSNGPEECLQRTGPGSPSTLIEMG
jgi:Glycosyltransferase family 87